MKFSALSRTGFAVALTAALASMTAPARAELNDSIFSKVSPSVRDRMFFRLNYVFANVKTTASEAHDVTGPVMGRNDITTYLYNPNTNAPIYTSRYYSRSTVTSGGTVRKNYNTNYFQYAGLPAAIGDDVALGYSNEANGLGTPNGITARSQDNMSLPVISAGYFLGDDQSWYVEAMLLAAPLKVKVQGDGVNGSGKPNGINGKDIINLKLLPPIGIVGYYFGQKQDVIRPFVGLGASYAIFFDARATEELNAYQGGGNVGDTTVTLKNSFGVGPFLGAKAQLSDVWHIGFSVGKLRYKTEATLTTRNTTITDSTGVLQDYSSGVVSAINIGNGPTLRAYTSSDTSNPSYVSGVTALMCDLAAAKGISNTCNYGTYVRKQNTILDTTMFMLSVGHSF